MVKEKGVRLITVGGVLSWFFGVLFGLVGLGSLMSSSFVMGVTFLILAIVLLPPMKNFFKEKMNVEVSKGLKIGIVILGLIIMSIMNPPQLNSPEPVPIKESEIPKEKVYSQNEKIMVDYLIYEVVKTETFREMGTAIFNKKTNGKFVKVYLEITNNAKETKQIFSPRFKIEDNQGRKYDRLSDDMLYIADYLQFGQQLQPGLTTAGAIIFELPRDSEELVLIIKGDWVSVSETKVSLATIKEIGVDATQKEKQDKVMDEVMVDAEKQMEKLMNKYN